MKVKPILAFITFFIFLSVPVFAQSIDPNVISVLTFIFGPEAGNYITDYSQILQFLIFPLLTIFAVMYGILETLNFFQGHRNIHAAIAALITFMAAYTGGVLAAVRVFYGFLGWMGVFAFGVLLFIGILVWFAAHFMSFGGRYRSIIKDAEKITSLEKEIATDEEKLQEMRALLQNILDDEHTPKKVKDKARDAILKIKKKIAEKEGKVRSEEEKMTSKYIH